MPALLELLDQYFFSDVPGMQARTALVQGWEQVSGMTWSELYVQATADALAEELPHLSAYSGYNTVVPTHQELEHALTADLGEAGNALRARDLSSGAYLTELARAMQAQRLILVNQHNLFTDEYRQILLNLFDFAHTRFKNVLTDHSDAFADALAQAAQHDAILTASIAAFLTRQFGITLAALPDAPAAPPPPMPYSTPEPIAIPAEPTKPAPKATAAPEYIVDTTAPVIPPPIEPISTVSIETTPQTEISAPLPVQLPSEHPTQNRLRVLLATPADVLNERALLTELIQNLSARARARFGLELELITPTQAEIAGAKSAVELTDIFIGAVWLHFGASSLETNNNNNETYFAGTENDFSLALEQAGGRSGGGWLRTVIYRSIRPPLDLLHLNVAEYTRVQQFFEHAGAFAGEDFVRVYNDSSELLADAQARLEAWIYNFAADLANALTEYGKTFAIAGQTADALADLEQAGALYRELDRPEQELNVWLQVAALYRQTQQPAQADDALDAALRLAQLTQDDNAAAVTLHQRGLLAADAQDWQTALSTFQQARAYLAPDAAIYRDILADEISAHEQLGDAAAQDNPTRARGAYRDALALAQEIDDTTRASVLWQKLAALAEAHGEWDNALEAYHQAAVNLDPNAPAHERIALIDAQANAQLQLAIQARDDGAADEAERAYRAALDLNEQGSRNRARRVEIFAALGALAAGAGLWENAVQSNNLALEQLTAPEDAPLRATLAREQADAYKHLGDTKFTQQALADAGDAYRQALDLYLELDARTEQGAMLYQLGLVSSAQERWKEANAYFTQAFGRLDAPEAQPTRAAAQYAQATCLAHIGDAHRDAQEWGQAEIAYLQARGNLEQLNKSDETGALLTQLGIVTAAQGRLQEAIAFFEQARARLNEPAHAEIRAQATRAQANTLRQIADLRRGAGDFAQAEAAYRQQLDLAQEIQDAALESDALHHLGLVSADRELWDDAVSYYDAALAQTDAIGSADAREMIQRHQLSAYEKLGERERAAHQLPQAEMAYRSALALAQALNENEREADLLYVLGLLSIEQENWDEALFNLRRALGIYNLMPNAPHKPQVIWNIGRAQRGSKRKQYESALGEAEQHETARDFAGATVALGTALRLAQELGDARSESSALERLGNVSSAQGDWNNALEYYQQATAKLAPDESERGAALLRAQVNALHERSHVARQNREWSSAERDLTLALESGAALNDRTLTSELWFARGEVAADRARWNDAIAFYSEALNARDENDVQRAAIEHAQANAYQKLGDSERDAQNWEGAETAYTQALALYGADADAQIRAPLFASLGDVTARQARWGEAVDFYTQARASSADMDAAFLETLDANLERAQLAYRRALQAEAEARGDTARAARDFETAHAEYLTAIALATELQDRSAQPELYAKLGLVETEQQDFDNALAHYRAAAGLYDAAEHSAQRATLLELQAETLQELGNRAGKAGDWDTALDYYQQAIALLDAPEQAEQRRNAVRLAAVTLQNRGDQSRANQDWAHALDDYRRAAGMFALLGQDDAQRTVLARQAIVIAGFARQARADGNFDTALAQYAQAAQLMSEAHDVTALNLLERERIGALTESGDALRARAEWARATDAYQEGYTLAQELGDRIPQADLLYRLGQVQFQQTQWQAALAYFDGAASLAQSEQLTDLHAQIRASQQEASRALGNAQRLDGAWDDAEANYNHALGIALERNDRASAGELYFVLGMLAADQNAWDKALGNYALALENVEPAYRADVKTYQALAFQNWGDAQRAAGQFDAAASAYHSALQGADELNDAERAANVLYRSGLLHATLGEWEQALDSYAQAETRCPVEDTELRAAIGSDKALAERALLRAQLDTQFAHAKNAQQTAQWDDAATAYRAALELAQKLDDAAERERAARALVAVYASKAATLQNIELWDEAQDAYRASWALAREFHFDAQTRARQDDLLALGFARVQALRANDALDDASQAAHDTLNLAREFDDTDKQADALYLLGALASQQRQWNDAKNYFEQARPLLVAAERSDALLDVDHELAMVNDVLRRQALQQETFTAAEIAAAENDFARADSSYRASLDLARGLDNPALVASIGAALVKLASDQARHAQQTKTASDAEQAYRQAIAVAQEFGDTDAARTQQRALIALAQEQTAALEAQQDFANAERAAQQMFALAQEFSDTHAQADALFTLGALSAAQNDWHAAQSYYEQARPLYAAQDREVELARLDTDLATANDILNRQAQLEQAQLTAQRAAAENDFARAESSYRASLDLARGFDNSALITSIGAALVKLASDKAQHTRQTEPALDAEQAYRQAIAVAQEFGDADAMRAQQRALIALAQEQTAAFQARQDFANAARAAQQTLALAQEFEDTRAQVDAYAQLGALAAEQRQWETALQHYHESIALLTEPEDAGRVAELGAEIERVSRARKTDQRDQARAQGDAAYQSKNWQAAETAYAASLALSQELGDTDAQGEIQTARAQAAAAQGEWTQSAALYTAALAAFGLDAADPRHTELVRSRMDAWQAAGQVAEQAQDYSTALAQYAEALSDANQLGDQIHAVALLRQLANVAVAQNDLRGALAYYDNALEVLGASDDALRRDLLSSQAALWQRFGDAEMEAHHLSEAQTAFENASALYGILERPSERAIALHRLGLTASAQGHWTDALNAHHTAYNLVRDLDIPEIHSELLESLGDAHWHLDNPEAARADYTQALTLTKLESRRAAHIHTTLGEIGMAQQLWQDAISHFMQATVLYDEIGDTAPATRARDNAATCYAQLGDLYYGEGNWQDADAAYVNALALDHATARTDRDAGLWYRLARADAAQEQYAEAIEHYETALAALDDGEIELRDRILGQLAFTLQQQGKLALAQDAWPAAQTLLERALKMAVASDHFDQAADVSLALGHALTAQEKFADATFAYRSALTFDQRDGNGLRAREIEQALATCLLENARVELDNAQTESATDHLLEAAPYAERAGNPLLLGEVLETLGDAAAQPEQAIEYYAQAGRQYASLEAMELWRRVSTRQAQELTKLAAQQLERETYADAENSYRRALLLQQASDDTAAYGETYFGLGRALAAQGAWRHAADALDHAQEHWQDERASRDALLALHANVLEHIGDDAAAERNWSDAHAAYQRAAEMQDALEARTASGANWHKIAQIAVVQELWDNAADANAQALARLDDPEAAEIRRAVLSQQAQILGHIGQAQQRAGELGLASETYRRALVIAQEQGNLSTLAELYTLLGSLAEAQAEWDTAATEYHHALDVYAELEQPVAQAETWTRLGDMHRTAQQYEQASDAFESARELYRANKLPLAEGAMLHRLGLVRADTEDWDGALDWYDHALTLYNEHNARSPKIEIYHSMELAVRHAKHHAAQLATLEGDALMDAGDMQGAEKAYREALALYAEAQEHVLEAQMQNQLGVTLEAQQRYDEALEQYHAARLGFQAQEIPEAEISVLANIGDVERQRAQWHEAETAYRNALALNQELDDPLRAAELYLSLGHVRQAQNDWHGAMDYYENARQAFAAAGADSADAEAGLTAAQRGARLQEQADYEQALAVARENDDLAEQGELLNTLGLMAAEDGEWHKALDYYNQAVRAFEQLEREEDNDAIWRTAQGTVLNNIGDASQALGAWQDADRAYSRALEFAREFRDVPSEAILLANLGSAAQHLQEYPRALDLNVQAYNTYTALGETTPQAELLERIGNLQVQLEQTDTAEHTFEQALRAAQAAHDSERAARVLMQLGHLAEARGANTETLAYYMRALEIAQTLGQAHEEKILHYRIGNVHARRGDWEHAANAYQAAYALALAQEDKPLQAKLTAQLGIAAAERGEWRQALEYHQAALAFAESENSQAEIYLRLGRAHAALDEYPQAETALRTALERMQATDANESGALWLELADLAKRQTHWQDATNYYARARTQLASDTAFETHIELALQQGDAALNIPDRDTAQACYDEAFELAQQHNDRVHLGVVYERLGVLAQSRREWDDALANLQEAIEIQREIQAPLGEARILNDIARLKIEMQNASEADLFAQAALAIAQAFGSAPETSRSLYVRALVALEIQELDLAERFLTQAIAADPNNAFAQLQLGNTLLALGRADEARLQAEAGRGHSAEWELGAQTQLAIAALNADDTRAFRQNLKQTRSLLSADAEQRRVSNDFVRAVELVVEALEGNAESTLGELEQMRNAPGLPTTLDAAQFARTALLALAKSARRFKGKPALVTYFAPPKPRSRKAARRKSTASDANTTASSE